MNGETSPAGQQIAVAVVERDGQFLIGLRPEGVTLAGYWEFPGGKIRADESPAAAAIRECREETALKVEITGEYPTVEHAYDHGTLMIHFFACRTTSLAQPLPGRFRWVDRKSLGDYEFPPANRRLLELLTRGA